MPKIESVDLGIALGEPLPAAERTKHSGFFITINTNLAPEDDELPECAERLRQAVVKLLDDEDSLKSIITYLDTGGWDDIISIKSEHVVEQGSQQHRVHAHAVMHVDHNTKIRLKREAIETIILDNFNSFGDGCHLSNVYVNIRAIQVPGSIKAYLEKGLAQPTKRTTPRAPKPTKKSLKTAK